MKSIILAVFLSCAIEVVAVCQMSTGEVDPNKYVLYNGKEVAYKDALPALTKDLDSKAIETKIKAAGCLQSFGKALIGTEALEKLMAIIESQEDFSTLDHAIADASQQGSPALSPNSSRGRIAKVAALKTEALVAGIMSGDPRAVQNMNRLISSNGLTEHSIGANAKLWYDSGDGKGWEQGGKPPLDAQPRFYIGGKQLKSSDYLDMTGRAIETADFSQLSAILSGMDQAAAMQLLKNQGGFATLTKLLSVTSAFTQKDPKFRILRSRTIRNIITAIELASQDTKKMALDFLQECLKDPDDDIANSAAVVISSIGK